MINVTPTALPSGDAPPPPPPPNGIPSVTPWTVYDLFCLGQTVEEIAFDGNKSEADVRADIDQMRIFLRDRHGPGLSDADCDELHGIARLSRAAYVEGSAASFKLVESLQEQRRNIVTKAAERHEEKQL